MDVVVGITVVYDKVTVVVYFTSVDEPGRTMTSYPVECGDHDSRHWEEDGLTGLEQQLRNQMYL
jgi:hypothetical protein